MVTEEITPNKIQLNPLYRTKELGISAYNGNKIFVLYCDLDFAPFGQMPRGTPPLQSISRNTQQYHRNSPFQQ